MEWSLKDLVRDHKHEPLQFDETVDVKADLTSRDAVQVLDVDPVNVKGVLSVDKGHVILYVRLKTQLTVPSTRSLTPVKLPLDFSFTEFYVGDAAAVNQFEEDDVVIVVEDDVIDFSKAVADNILLQIPMQVLSDEEVNSSKLPEGPDWEVIREDELEAHKAENKQVDPRLAKLKELFPDQEDNH
ncbi:DNA-binding protein [Secundilactobacillus oryzae JCM 18671]|uniref:DNA-binding protein n=2 Tax=Secundilactobacillus oryzae TaxID=1202668 RepID=A0A081BG16_9LACO|nr:YceD family protein [Secundilactobacillus oryzae]GAK46984.1 DNA-binding protein [Secundilactobacillus oryzae JCM 18671]